MERRHLRGPLLCLRKVKGEGLFDNRCWTHSVPTGQKSSLISASQHTKQRNTIQIITSLNVKENWGFPGGLGVKESPGNAGNTGLIPSPGRSHMPQGDQTHGPQLLSQEQQLLKPESLCSSPRSRCKQKPAITREQAPFSTTRESPNTTKTQHSQK